MNGRTFSSVRRPRPIPAGVPDHRTGLEPDGLRLLDALSTENARLRWIVLFQAAVIAGGFCGLAGIFLVWALR